MGTSNVNCICLVVVIDNNGCTGGQNYIRQLDWAQQVYGNSFQFPRIPRLFPFEHNITLLLIPVSVSGPLLSTIYRSNLCLNIVKWNNRITDSVTSACWHRIHYYPSKNGVYFLTKKKKHNSKVWSKVIVLNEDEFPLFSPPSQSTLLGQWALLHVASIKSRSPGRTGEMRIWVKFTRWKVRGLVRSSHVFHSIILHNKE